MLLLHGDVLGYSSRYRLTTPNVGALSCERSRLVLALRLGESARTPCWAALCTPPVECQHVGRASPERLPDSGEHATEAGPLEGPGVCRVEIHSPPVVGASDFILAVLDEGPYVYNAFLESLRPQVFHDVAHEPTNAIALACCKVELTDSNVGVVHAQLQANLMRRPVVLLGKPPSVPKQKPRTSDVDKARPGIEDGPDETGVDLRFRLVYGHGQVQAGLAVVVHEDQRRHRSSKRECGNNQRPISNAHGLRSPPRSCVRPTSGR